MADKAKNKYGLKCSQCGSTQIWKTGFVPTIGGRKDRFKCTVCAHSFYKGQPGTIDTSSSVAKKSGGKRSRWR